MLWCKAVQWVPSVSRFWTKVLNPSYFIDESVVQTICDLHSKHVLQCIGGDVLSLHLFRTKDKLKHVSFMSLSVWLLVGICLVHPPYCLANCYWDGPNLQVHYKKGLKAWVPSAYYSPRLRTQTCQFKHQTQGGVQSIFCQFFLFFLKPVAKLSPFLIF